MLDKIINNPDLEKYMISFESDQIIFLEGDDSQDLYILVSGQLDILKGIEVAFQISEDSHLTGWLIFQMDTELLNNIYGIDEEDLKKFQFKKS